MRSCAPRDRGERKWIVVLARFLSLGLAQQYCDDEVFSAKLSALNAECCQSETCQDGLAPTVCSPSCATFLRDIQLGVTSNGLVVFQNCIKINTFSWTKIVKISFKRKQFFIQLRKELTESYDTLLG